MPNEPLGGHVEGRISKGIENQAELAKQKRHEAVRRLADYGQALVDGNDDAAREAMDAIGQAAREASEAERWVRQNLGVMDTAKAKAADLGSWRDIISAGQSGDFTSD